MKILLIDDSPRMLFLLHYRRHLPEHEFFYCSNGSDGVEFVKNNPEIEMIFLDFDMGLGIIGSEAARLLREEAKFEGWIIGNSTCDDSNRRIVAAGGDGYFPLGKMCDIKTIRAVIDSLVKSRKAIAV